MHAHSQIVQIRISNILLINMNIIDFIRKITECLDCSTNLYVTAC